MKRDFEKNPYSPDERRVAEYFYERGLGGGDDPIGFLLASYTYLIHERNALSRELKEQLTGASADEASASVGKTNGPRP